MVSKLHFYGFVLSLIFISNNVFATEYTVNSASQFNALDLQPCDVVTWTNGTYSNQDINFNAIGESGSPIVLKAETPGGVIFTGTSEMNIWGDYLIVDGFYWNGGIGTNNHVEFRQSGSNSNFANNTIFRNCAFNDLQPEDPIEEPDAKSRWIVLYGSNNTVENCSFLNKDTTGVCILVELIYAAGTSVSHTLINNYFYNVTPKDGRLNAGDSEGIRIGSSSYQTIDANVTVENNYFKEVDGENEIISNKSLGNTYRNNTFRKCRGSLVLRHGAQALVEGNYFIGENKANSGGIRISDQDHIIINNYMQGLNNASSSFNNGITLMGGDTASGGTSNGYQTVSNVLIAFNTIYNSDDPILFNDSRGSNIPEGIIANNVIYSTNGTIVSGAISTIGGLMNYDGNIFGGSTIGVTDSGITVANANFSASGEIYKPSASGPVANASAGTYNQVTIDVEGFTRPNTNKDVGAHEVLGASGTATNPTPITDTDVGNGIGACFLDDLAIASSTECPVVEYGSSCDPISVTGVTVNPNTATIMVEETIQLTAILIPSNATNTNVTWTSENNSIASVDTNGLVTGENPGTVSITVTTEDGMFIDAASIEVSEPLTAPDCPEGTNLSLTATVVSYTDQQAENPATNVIDGDPSNRWSAETFPQSMVIDLGDALNVNEINLYPYQNRDYQYLVEGSQTSASSGYETLVNRQTNTDQGTVFNDLFEVSVVRYIRLTVVGAATYDGPWCSISDMEIICAGANLSLPELSFEHTFNIYPNPFKDDLSIKFLTNNIDTISTIRIVDFTGKTIYKYNDIAPITSLKFDTKLSNGLYFIQIINTNNQVIATRKVIKK